MAKVPGFIGPSNTTQAKTADVERTVNWFVEPTESQGATARAALNPTPGVSSIGTGTSNPGRAHFFENDREFAVIGTVFYEISAQGILTSRGTVALDNNPATISSNGDGGDQLFITSGGNGYYYNLTTNTLTQITALNGLATMGDQLDGYFLALDANTSTMYISALLDGSSWTTGVDFAQRSIASDPWIAMRVLGRYVWLLGEQTSEVWYNTGATFPFAPHPSGLVRYGVSAPWSVAIADNQIFWLGASKFGMGWVLRAAGFTPEVVSSFAMHSAVNDFARPEDAQAFAYSEEGHTFYVISFLSDSSTWCYDTNTRQWHERGTWISEEGHYVAWRPRWYARAFNEDRILDGSTGGIYRMGSEYFTDVDSREIRRVRRAPAMQNQTKRLFYKSFELDLEPGLGAVTGQGSDPQVMMRFSDDGGKTWSSEYQRSAGALGNYGRRVRWERLGVSRRRVFEVSVSDPIAWRITDAYVDVEPAQE